MLFATTNLVGEALSYNPAVPNSRAQALAAVFGALLGDALGVPHEFKSAADLPPRHAFTLAMPAEYKKSYSAIPYGTWSDDGSQLLCLLESLEAGNGRLSLDDFASRLMAWYAHALHQAGGLVFDCGGQTGYALRRLQRGIPPAEAALDQYTGAPDRLSNGNGSLMRALPVALSTTLWGLPAHEAVRTAIEQSRVTHAHPVALMTCAVFTQVAIMAMRGVPRMSWLEMTKEAGDYIAVHAELAEVEREALAHVLAYIDQELPTGHGYAPNTLWSAIAVLDRSTNYLEAVQGAIALGNDTDTTATVAGGLAALAYGLSSVPAEWLELLIVPVESGALLDRLPR